jgi:hypothetical protein
MDKIFLAVVVFGILMLIAAAGLFALAGRRPRSRRHPSRSASSGTEESEREALPFSGATKTSCLAMRVDL